MLYEVNYQKEHGFPSEVLGNKSTVAAEVETVSSSSVCLINKCVNTAHLTVQYQSVSFAMSWRQVIVCFSE